MNIIYSSMATPKTGDPEYIDWQTTSTSGWFHQGRTVVEIETKKKSENLGQYIYPLPQNWIMILK